MKFHDDKRTPWFCPFERASKPTYHGRGTHLEQKAAKGCARGDVQKMANLLMADADDEAIVLCNGSDNQPLVHR
jgi:hypothetical protein